MLFGKAHLSTFISLKTNQLKLKIVSAEVELFLTDQRDEERKGKILEHTQSTSANMFVLENGRVDLFSMNGM